MSTSKKKAFTILLVLVAIFALALDNATVAHASSLTSHIQSKHPITPLANCLVTFTPHVNNEQERTCLVKATAQTLSPNAVRPGCSMDYYQNGPYGSSAWANGWAECAVGFGTYYVFSSLNDQASAWDSLCDGVFFANQPWTDPGAYFPPNSAGNFPWGGVPNDSLSSFYVYDC